jgi:hypothetical protein
MYIITLRSIVGYYDGSGSNFSTDPTRAKLFYDRDDADLVANQLRQALPRIAPYIDVVTPMMPSYSPHGLARAIAMAVLFGMIGVGVGWCAEAGAETMVPQSSVGMFGCPDLGYYKKSMDETLAPNMDARRVMEHDYNHGCTMLPMGLGGEIIARVGPYIRFRPCTWTTSFWTVDAEDPKVRLRGDRCAP